MKVILTTEKELERMIEKTTRKVLRDVLPTVLREASRKEWLTTDDVMEYLQCSRRHVQHLRDSGKLSFRQNGRMIRYHVEDVLHYLNKGRVNRRDNLKE